MRSLFLKALFVAFSLGGVLTACKEPATEQPLDIETETTSQAVDASLFRQETDGVHADVIGFLTDTTRYRFTLGRVAAGCSPTRVDSIGKNANGKTIWRLTFDGKTECNGRTRSGTITVQLIRRESWRLPDAVAQITYNNFEISRIYLNKPERLRLSGTQVVINQRGGIIKELAVGDSLVHRVRGSVQNFINNGVARTWNTYVVRSCKNTGGGQAQVVIKGDTGIGSNTNVIYTGTNRYGNSFITNISSSIVTQSQCTWATPVGGVFEHIFNDRRVTVTLGTNFDGVPSGGCPRYFKIAYLDRRNRPVIRVYSY